MPTNPLDVAGPGLLGVLGAGLGLGVVWYLAVIVIEAVILRAFRWANFWRSLLGSFLMNTLTTLVGIVLVGAFLFAGGSWVLVLVATFVAWLLSVALEWGVLALMDRTKLQRAFIAALVANVATYLPVVVIYVIIAVLARSA